MIVALSLLIGLQGPIGAQTTAPDPATAALLKKVEDLESNLALVKAELARRGLIPTASPSSTPPAAIPAAPAAPEPALDAATAAMLAADSAGHDYHALGPLQIRGYSDFGFGRPMFDNQPDAGLRGSTNSFTLGDFDLFVTAQISDRLSVLGEMLVTSDFTNNFNVEMDRALLTYSYNKYFNISAGKYNTAIGFYTNEFHRARFFQTATDRPLLFADEDAGGILPVHSVGVSATGVVPSGKLGLHWVAELANGRSASNPDARIQNFIDENNGKAFNLAVYARPEFVPGLEVGVSLYRDRLNPITVAPLNQHIYSAHAAYIRPHLELLGEGVRLEHTFLNSGHSFDTVSAYFQASYQMRRIRPYFRYDYQNVPSSDPIFGILGRENGPSVGARYEFSDFGNFKLQFGRLSTRDRGTTNDVQAQIAFAF